MNSAIKNVVPLNVDNNNDGIMDIIFSPTNDIAEKLDKEPPVINVSEYTTKPTNKDITITASVNEGTLNKISHTFKENGIFVFVATDTAGNISKKTVIVNNIDKVPPIINENFAESYNQNSDLKLDYSAIDNASELKDSYILFNNTKYKNGDVVKLNKTGENIIEVVAEDNAENISRASRTINVRAGGSVDSNSGSSSSSLSRSSNSKLAKITLSSGTLNPIFSKNVTNYDITLDKTVVSLKLTTQTEDPKAKISIYSKNFGFSLTDYDIRLTPNQNKIELVVTAEDGSKKTYTINIKPSQQSEAKSTNNNLDVLTLTPGFLTPGFSNRVTQYELEESRGTKELELNAKTQDEKSKIFIDGIELGNDVKNLKISLDKGKETVEVKVVAENGDKKIYKVDIQWEKQPPTELPTFLDIKNHWALSYINTLAKGGIISGYADKTIKPDNNITRGEISKILALAKKLKLPEKANLTYRDNASIPEWCKKYVDAVSKNNIIKGYNDNTFRSENLLTRAEMAAMIIRLLGYDNLTDSTSSFVDSAIIPPWAKSSVVKAVELSIISGYSDNTYKPDKYITRAEAFKMIAKAISQIK
jgi:hypothetical protein